MKDLWIKILEVLVWIIVISFAVMMLKTINIKVTCDNTEINQRLDELTQQNQYIIDALLDKQPK